MQEGAQHWQPSDLLRKKVFRPYPRKFDDPRPARDHLLPAADGAVPSDREHVQRLIAEARQAGECAPSLLSRVLSLLWQAAAVNGMVVVFFSQPRGEALCTGGARAARSWRARS